MFSSSSFLLSCLLTLSLAAETCYEGPGGASPTEARAGGHNIQVTKAMISKPAPDFSGTAVINGEFTEIKLSDYKGKYLVFFFYPLDFTFVCPTEILAFNDRVAEFKKIGAEVLACSVDSHFTHLAWMNTPRKEGGLGKLDIPLLSDLTHTISKGEQNSATFPYVSYIVYSVMEFFNLLLYAEYTTPFNMIVMSSLITLMSPQFCDDNSLMFRLWSLPRGQWPHSARTLHH